MNISGYNRIFWGMIILAFHINLGYLTMLPSCIGYLCIYSGLSILSIQYKAYKKGKIPSIILSVLTVGDIWHDPNINIFNLQPYNLHLISYLLYTLIAVINLYLIYIICRGMCAVCTERGLNQSISDIKNSWNFYLGISLIRLFYTPFIINIPSNDNFILMIIAVFQTIMFIYVIITFKNCKSELAA